MHWFKTFKKKRDWRYLFFGIVLAACLGGIVYFLSPGFSIPLFVISLPILYLFFLFLFGFFYYVILFFFTSRKHAILISAFICMSLLFLANNLLHPFFFILLAGLFLVIELIVVYNK